MLFPLIKIKTPHGERIVGTELHDQLNIQDGKTIAYYNLQNGEGSAFGEYQFVGDNCPHMGVTVEFVTFETLQELYKVQCAEDERREEKRRKVYDSLWIDLPDDEEEEEEDL